MTQELLAKYSGVEFYEAIRFKANAQIFTEDSLDKPGLVHTQPILAILEVQAFMRGVTASETSLTAAMASPQSQDGYHILSVIPVLRPPFHIFLLAEILTFSTFFFWILFFFIIFLFFLFFFFSFSFFFLLLLFSNFLSSLGGNYYVHFWYLCSNQSP